MKTLKQVCAASVLTLLLSLSAFAGEIETTFTTPPQSATTMGEIQTTMTGQIDTMLTSTTTEITLALLAGVFSLI